MVALELLAAAGVGVSNAFGGCIGVASDAATFGARVIAWFRRLMDGVDASDV